MSTYVREKKIIVRTAGWIDMIGAMGPILSPFKCDTKKIMHMVNTKKEVYEILDSGNELKLDLKNYELDNNALLAAKAKQAAFAKSQEQSVTNNQGTQNSESTNTTTVATVTDKETTPTTTNTNENKNKTYNDKKNNK